MNPTQTLVAVAATLATTKPLSTAPRPNATCAPRRCFAGLFRARAAALSLLAVVAISAAPSRAQPIIVDHTCTNLQAIPDSAILAAKAQLHIAYGHTSHGSQLITGMDGLVTWKGALYAWNSTGAGGALHLRDYYGNFGGSTVDDLGSHGPDWADATRTYLNSHPEINVIIWSWCGQVSGYTPAQISQYLSLM